MIPFADSIGWRATAPSNIAFQKYWGKRDADLQWPANDSISMSLTTAKTTTTVFRSILSYDTFSMGQSNYRSDLEPNLKIFRHLNRLRSELGFKESLHIESENSFPSDCGIASSASGFAALTLSTLCALFQTSDWDELQQSGLDREKIAHFSRLGSGSAGRSVFGGYVHWIASDFPQTQRLVQIFPESHLDLCDLILVFSDSKKSMNSSTAHLAAPKSRFFNARIRESANRTKEILHAIQTKNVEILGQIIESECLDMHSVAATGQPSINYFTNETVSFMEWLRLNRSEMNLPAWFTIDAGPNPHVICESSQAERVLAAIRKSWPKVKIINDRVGSGPKLEKIAVEYLSPSPADHFDSAVGNKSIPKNMMTLNSESFSNA